MKCNVSKFGQIVRLLAGMILVAWAVAGGPAWTWVGLALAATGAWRFCPIFMILGLRSIDSERPDSRNP